MQLCALEGAYAPPPCSLHYLDIVPELITGPPSLVCGPIDGREEAANGPAFQFVD